eukprot:392707_1
MDTQELHDAFYEAQTQKRYDQMCDIVQKLVKLQSTNGKQIDYEIRSALSFAYEKWIEEKRKLLDKIDTDNKHKNIIKTEITNKCNEILNLIQKYIIKNINDKESEMEVFFLQLRAKYNRILSEISENNKIFQNTSKTLYIKAMELSKKILNAEHPTYLKVVIGYTTLLYEVLNEKEKAFEISKHEFELGLAELDELSSGAYKDTTIALQIIYDNINIWIVEITKMKRDQSIQTINGYIRETHKYILSLPQHLTIPKNINQVCFDYYYVNNVEFKINS